MSDTSRYGKYWPQKGPINLLLNYNVNLATQVASGLGFSTRFYGIRIFGIAIGILVKRVAQFEDELWMYPQEAKVEDIGADMQWNPDPETHPIDYSTLQAIQAMQNQTEHQEEPRNTTGSEL